MSTFVSNKLPKNALANFILYLSEGKIRHVLYEKNAEKPVSLSVEEAKLLKLKAKLLDSEAAEFVVLEQSEQPQQPQQPQQPSSWFW